MNNATNPSVRDLEQAIRNVPDFLKAGSTLVSGVFPE
jgi:hypothetical protein